MGSIFGQPALGWSIGTLLAPHPGSKQERGKLDDLRITGSSYGTTIPIVFGQALVGGEVIWAPDQLHQTSHTVGGKGHGQTVKQYDYDTSVAYGWCEGNGVEGIRRIWLDDKLVYDTSKNPPTKLKLTNYLGGPDQQPDPTILAAKGVGNTPAYKDWCYSVFKDLPLADYGSRIPQGRAEIACPLGGVADPSLPIGRPVFRFGRIRGYYLFDGPWATGEFRENDGGEIVEWLDSISGHAITRDVEIGPQYQYSGRNGHPVAYVRDHNTIGDGDPSRWTDLHAPMDAFLALSIPGDSWVENTVIYRGILGVKCRMGPPGQIKITGDDSTYLVASGVPQGQWFVLECYHGGANSWIRVNGGPKTTGDSGTGGTGVAGLNIGEPSNNGAFYLGEMLGYSGGQIDSDEAKIVAEMKTYWGIA